VIVQWRLSPPRTRKNKWKRGERERK